jgi:hypothetical protein
VDKLLLQELDRAYPHKNVAYKIKKSRMKDIMEDCFTYGYFHAIDELFEIVKKNPEVDKDVLLGEFHIFISEKLNQVKGINIYKVAHMKNIEWLIEFSKK